MNPTRFFGYDLGYDNANSPLKPNSYTPQYNGNIGGLTWSTIGDREKRKYNFAYDAANRLIKADFTQYNGATSSFDKSAGLDFSVKLGDGVDPTTAYDANGNIKKMEQFGWKAGSSSAIDILTYENRVGTNPSNKLAKVTDDVSANTTKLGDFLNGVNTGDDYEYDVNGNLIVDGNKSIASILYNHLNLPYEINLTGKGKITFTYDALGTKLKKTVLDNTSGTAVTTTWIYLQNFVYKNEMLEFFSHEEGRARYEQTEGTAETKAFDFDYFLKDHLGNVRMVLTEELETVPYTTLTFEDANLAEQNTFWENAAGGSVNAGSRNSRPAVFGTVATNGSYAKLIRKSTGPIGAAKLLKVMAGDRIHTQVDYLYFVSTANNTGASGINSLLTSLATSIFGSAQVPSVLKGAGTALTAPLSSNADFVNLLNTPNTTSGTNQSPKAYLNVLFFDEQFRPDNSASRVIPVQYSPGQKGTISKILQDAISVKKNGYAYVYFSNESDDIVYFDNFMLTHELGPIREETHYYPFGLTMAGISSAALKPSYPTNKYKFNGIEQSNEFDINMYDAFYRNLDPQTGRFWQIDPKIESAEAWSPYAAMLDNPIRYADPLGDSSIPGAGFWRNVWEGIKDGGNSTVGFVKSLGTTEGWKDVGNGLLDLADRTSGSPSGMLKNIATGEAAIDYISNVPNMTRDEIGHDVGFGLEKTAEAVVLTKGAGAVKNAINGVKAAEVGNEIGVLREASQGSGNFGLGQASAKTSNKLGQAWVGEGAKTASDGKTLVSQDGLKQYRSPSAKPNSSHATTGIQSNFESRNVSSGKWINNGHLNITNKPWWNPF